jgi:hypothetical protein
MVNAASSFLTGSTLLSASYEQHVQFCMPLVGAEENLSRSIISNDQFPASASGVDLAPIRWTQSGLGMESLLGIRNADRDSQVRSDLIDADSPTRCDPSDGRACQPKPDHPFLRRPLAIRPGPGWTLSSGPPPGALIGGVHRSGFN